ncbi:MAG: S8 family serine peptidase [Planctomycetota bacterium]|nr:S8 family serine peptidase [Planctomycetota bacterium]
MYTLPRALITLALGVAVIGPAPPAPAAVTPDSRSIDDEPDRMPQREYTLHLGGISFDPLRTRPALPPGWEAGESENPALRLVQFTGPTRDGWLEALRASGVEIVQYVHPYSYIVWSDGPSVELAGALPAVRWTGAFEPAYRVLPEWRTLPDEAIAARVLLYRGADADAAVREVIELGAVSTGRRVLNRTFEAARFVVSGARFRDMANIPGVYSIKPLPTGGGLRGEMSDQICAGNYDENNAAFPGYLDWLDGIGVDGSGVIIANVDGGIQDNHPDLGGRLVGCTGQTCGGGASSSHGTHTAGIMAADGSAGVLDGYGFLRGLGVAPGANLLEQVYSPWYTYPDGMLMLMADSYANGASLSGNSWGPSGWPLGYDDDTMQVDIGTRDTDPDTPGDQPLLYVLSIMNGYGGVSSQGTPDEAKNIFTIGSTKMQNSNGSQILQINDLSSNSAHGPCLDGRKIPHLVAPGCRVDSTDTYSSYGLKCGTSMASPHVSGAVALFIEHYRNLTRFERDPSPALIKAAFLPVAYDLAGHDDADGNPMGHPFDNKQGWGRLNLDAVLDVDPTTVQYFDNPVIFDSTDEQWSVELEASDPDQPVKLMLVWTDAPGHGLGGSTPAWNNDLDLVVEAGGETYRGNNFGADGFSTAGGAADYQNNTEGVFLAPGEIGSFTVRIVAANINSDGLPNSGDGTDQDFALVCYNVAADNDCPADFDGDGDVDTADLLFLLEHWGTGGGDVDDDGDTDAADLLALLSAWGDCGA